MSVSIGAGRRKAEGTVPVSRITMPGMLAFMDKVGIKVALGKCFQTGSVKIE